MSTSLLSKKHLDNKIRKGSTGYTTYRVTRSLPGILEWDDGSDRGTAITSFQSQENRTCMIRV